MPCLYSTWLKVHMSDYELPPGAPDYDVLYRMTSQGERIEYDHDGQETKVVGQPDGGRVESGDLELGDGQDAAPAAAHVDHGVG